MIVISLTLWLRLLKKRSGAGASPPFGGQGGNSKSRPSRSVGRAKKGGLTMNEKAKRLLKAYRENAIEIERLEREIEMWAARSQRADCEELCAILSFRLRNAVEKRIEAEKLLQAVACDRLQLLLTLHYIDGLTWERVSERMGYDLRYVMRLHKRALETV